MPGRNPRLIEDGGERDSFLDQLRVVPTQCTEKKRREYLTQGWPFAGELLTTSDQGRVWRVNEFVGPAKCLGDVADEPAMLALGGTLEEPAGVGSYPGDWCYRSDLGGQRWNVITGFGLELSDWRADPLSSGGEPTASLEPVTEDGEIMFDSDEDDEDGEILMEEAEGT